ncbi:hypothetical protein AOC36_05200 [Erysipelothrix larvae]|uniref:dihydrofolate reductase n=1 Tax=Erysipelothrix larvae TaxID=1514105 RepID=A0A0X8GZT2_9FIRM|nr:dihydrofolate reductase [Erysipelothrix larvae]AMC93395.1 hypothetical protein AOC36_05200 [Erysipelothrix larvae]
MITCIAAMNQYGTIGRDGVMPWHSSEDLKHFKSYTMGKDLCMGRVTYEGLPQKLRGRNIHVITTDTTYPNSIQDINAFFKTYKNSEKECVVCGGGTIYELLLPICDKLVLSFIKDNDVIGDTYFPSFSINEFRIKEMREFKEYNLVIYERVI